MAEAQDDGRPPCDKVPGYRVGGKLGKGGQGEVYEGLNSENRMTGSSTAKVAIKFQHKSKLSSAATQPNEWLVYEDIGDIQGVPRVHGKGSEGEYYFMIMDLLGENLSDIRKTEIMSDKMVAFIAIEAISILQRMHSKGYVHGDVKPNNLLLGRDVKPDNLLPGHADTPQENKLFLVDLGFATCWESSGKHVEYEQQPMVFRGGTLRYASVHTHLGRTVSRRDDLESLVYTLVFLLQGDLPWKKEEDREKMRNFHICKKKMDTSPENLCHSHPQPFKEFFKYVVNLKFDEEPDYAKCIRLFDDIADPCRRAINTDGAQQINQNGGNLMTEPSGEQLNRNVRTGMPAAQWISIYDAQKPMKQRYHYNVPHEILPQYIEKEKEESLFISSVASCKGLWALIMDAGTGLLSQVHKFSHSFLDECHLKSWIEKQWSRNYCITAIAGADDGSSLVVMSRGSKYGRQRYTVSKSFPFQWIKQNWNKKYYVTSMATAGSKWAVVMSRKAGFSKQEIELDFAYPVEGIRYWWDKGYHITATAATKDLAAFIMSVPLREPIDKTQETFRTSAFPSNHIKEQWTKNLYITSVCYGRTAS